MTFRTTTAKILIAMQLLTAAPAFGKTANSFFKQKPKIEKLQEKDYWYEVQLALKKVKDELSSNGRTQIMGELFMVHSRLGISRKKERGKDAANAEDACNLLLEVMRKLANSKKMMWSEILEAGIQAAIANISYLPDYAEERMPKNSASLYRNGAIFRYFNGSTSMDLSWRKADVNLDAKSRDMLNITLPEQTTETTLLKLGVGSPIKLGSNTHLILGAEYSKEFDANKVNWMEGRGLVGLALNWMDSRITVGVEGGYRTDGSYSILLPLTMYHFKGNMAFSVEGGMVKKDGAYSYAFPMNIGVEYRGKSVGVSFTFRQGLLERVALYKENDQSYHFEIIDKLMVGLGTDVIFGEGMRGLASINATLLRNYGSVHYGGLVGMEKMWKNAFGERGIYLRLEAGLVSLGNQFISRRPLGPEVKMSIGSVLTP